MQNIVRNGNYVQNHININTDIILLYGILQITVLFYMCAVFALGALHNFPISSGGKGNGTGGSYPLPPRWRRPWTLDMTLPGSRQSDWLPQT